MFHEVKREAVAPARIESQGQGLTAREAIMVAAQRAGADEAAKLYSLVVQLEERDAERQFNEALQRVKPMLPRIAKNGKIKMVKDGIDKGTIPFATYEDLDRIIRPILASQGFTTSFVGEDTEQQVGLRLVVRHSGGHTDRSSIMKAPPDKGTGRNDLQARGSTAKYLRRYLTMDYFDIVTEGADDDGAKNGHITYAQVESIQRYIATCVVDGENVVKDSLLLTTYGLKSLGELPKTMLEPAFTMLGAKYRAEMKKRDLHPEDVEAKIKKAWEAR